MLDLLLYCHLAARLRFPQHCDAIADCVAAAKSQCRRLLAEAAAFGPKHSARTPRGVEQELLGMLNRLDAYITSMA